MYLSYADYESMGGTLDEAAFNSFERKARYLINSQAGGRCGDRISQLAELPECVKDCVYELVAFFDINNAVDKQISSESQSQGGTSESISYVAKTDAELTAQAEGIIKDYFYGGGCGYLLYKGACL